LASLIDSEGVGVKKVLKFTRTQADKTVTVGRFLAAFKIVGDYNAGSAEGEYEPFKNSKVPTDIDRTLPSIEFGLSKWRVRVDARCCIGGPLNVVAKDGFPSLFIQTGWSQYKHEEPSSLTLIESSVSEDNRNPIWNEQLLLNNPAESDRPCNF